MRRQLGGGVTYLDSQQLFYQCIFHRSRSPAIPAQVYKARLEAPIKTLQKLGLDAELLYVNEIEISGKRIAGIGGGLIGEASVVVGNILNDFNYQAMTEIINAPCGHIPATGIGCNVQKDHHTESGALHNELESTVGTADW